MQQQDVNILVVDDEEDFRDIFSEIVKGLGYQAFTAKDGIAALKLLEKIQMDIAIIDYQMPAMDGMELLKAIKKNWPDVEVLFITGFGTVTSAVEAMKLGARDYITKPLNLEQVEKLIKGIVQTRTPVSESQSLQQHPKKKY